MTKHKKPQGITGLELLLILAVFIDATYLIHWIAQ